MSRLPRSALLAFLILLGLLALHIQLNRGGWRRAVSRLGAPGGARGDLVVGFLPVT